MTKTLTDLKRRLTDNAEAVCRRYLSNGRRLGNYWVVGDVHNTPGRSLYVRLQGPDAGRWRDAATSERGDLLDLMAAASHLATLRETFAEAERFLGAAPSRPASARQTSGSGAIPPLTQRADLVAAARRLFDQARPLPGTPADTYLTARGLAVAPEWRALRFHPRCRYRPDPDDAPGPDAWPAMIAGVTDLSGNITAAHRTWLTPCGRAKAPLITPRRALGHLLGHAVRFGTPTDVAAAGEGIETVLSLRAALPGLPLMAALTAGHLAAIAFPPTLRRLYILRDNDPAGHRAVATLTARARANGIEPYPLIPRLGDVNDDLRHLGPHALTAAICPQLAEGDAIRFG